DLSQFDSILVANRTEKTAIDQAPDYDKLLESADKSLAEKYYQQAIRQYSQCIELQPDDYWPIYNRGRVYYLSGNDESALEDLKNSAALNPTHIESYNHIIAVLYKSGEKEKADVWQIFLKEASAGETPDLSQFDSILLAERTNRAVNDKLKLADKSMAAKFHSQAIVEYSEYIDLRPKDYRGYFGRALAYYGSGRYEQALSDFEKSIELNPAHWGSYSEIIRLMNELGEVEEAEVWQICLEEAKSGKTPDVSQQRIKILAKHVNEKANVKMENWFVKDEFESTRMYKERTSEINKKATYYKFQNEALNEIAPSRKELHRLSYINYDADNETFVVQNEVFKEITLYVPIAEARSLKAAVPTVKMADLECEINDSYELNLRSFALAMGNRTITYQLIESFGYFESTDTRLQFREIDNTASISKTTTNRTGKGLALVIGNGEYVHGGKLLNPENDAQSMRNALERLG
ncbi:tetratricopeptide repeat protein, partial [Bacteroidota bacterium]